MAKSWWEKSKEDEQPLEELNSAHRRSKAKCQLVQTSYIKRFKLFLLLPYNKHLINRAKSVLACSGLSVVGSEKGKSERKNKGGLSPSSFFLAPFRSSPTTEGLEQAKSVWENLDLGRVYRSDLTAFGLYLRPRSRFSHTDLLLG